MATILKPKRSSIAANIPTTANLADGEFAVNTADKIIYQRVGANIIAVANYSTGTGGAPAGATGQIQFNDAGAFGGSANLIWDNANNDLILVGADTGITLQSATNEPPAPAPGKLHLYSKNIAGRVVPKVKDPSGSGYPLQAAFWQKNIVMWTPTNTNAGVWLGTVGAGAGSYTTPQPTPTTFTNTNTATVTNNAYTSIKRGRWANVANTTNQVLGQRNTEAMFLRGSVAGQGGFFFFARCGFDVYDSFSGGIRFFAGMHSSTAVVSANPSTLNNTVGFAFDTADGGNIYFLTRGTVAATKAYTGLSAYTNYGFDLYIFCAPNSSQIDWRIVNITTGDERSGTATLNLPDNTTLLTAGVLASNASNTTAGVVSLGINRIYVETDY